MAAPAYNDPEYRAAKRWLKTHPTECHLRLDGCTGMATTLDHQPALVDHQHQRGAHCCRLVPACHHCNSSDGAKRTPNTRATGYSWP